MGLTLWHGPLELPSTTRGKRLEWNASFNDKGLTKDDTGLFGSCTRTVTVVSEMDPTKLSRTVTI